MEPTRRELLQLAVAAWSAGCLREPRGRIAPVTTAVLEPDHASFLVAIATPRRVAEATVEIRGRRAVRTVRAALVDGIAAVEITDLAPDTAYEVTVLVDAGRGGTHRVRTAPRPDDPRPVRLAIIADVDPRPEFVSGLFDALVAEAPELIIAIGDFPYADEGTPQHSVAQYRARHAAVRGHPDVRAVLEAAGVRAIYDDHEYGNDWDRALAEADPAAYAAALRVWDEFFPLRTTGEIRYRSWRWGANLECFLLDCRRFRGRNAAPDDAAKTMLGATQRAWLRDGVARSTATFKLILTSVPLDFGVGDDHWAAYTTERDALFAELVDVPGVVFVSGDQHWFAAHRHAYGIREMQIGPLARGLGTPGPTAPGVLFRAVRYNAGLIELDAEHLTLAGLGADGERFYSETLDVAALTPRR